MATALDGPLAWEPPNAVSDPKKTTKKKKKEEKEKKKKKSANYEC